MTKPSIARFFFQLVDNKQYTNSIRDLIVITVYFILGLDLTKSKIHVIAQHIQKIRACIVAWQNVLPTEKSLVVSFGTFFKFLSNHGELERTETTKKPKLPKIIIDAGVFFWSKSVIFLVPLKGQKYRSFRADVSHVWFLDMLLFGN